MSYSALVDKVLTYCFDRFAWPRASRLFKQAIYTYVLVELVYWLFDTSALFSEQAYIFRQAKIFSGLHDLPFVLYNHPSLAIFMLVIGAILCIGGLFTYTFLFSDLLLWLIVINVHYAIYPGINGGHYLMNQLLLFNSFIRHAPQGRLSLPTQWRNFLSNLGGAAVQIQVCLVYIVAALAKLGDAHWQQGTAVWQTGFVKHFTWDSQVLFSQANWWTALLNYAVLIYQVCFPLVIWIPKLRRYVLLIGFAIYLYIGLFMGLLSFALIMILSHVYFWPWKTRQS